MLLPGMAAVAAFRRAPALARPVLSVGGVVEALPLHRNDRDTRNPMQQQVYQDQFQTVVLQLELPDWSWYKLTEVLGTWTG